MIFSFWDLLAVTLSLLYKKIARNFVYSCKLHVSVREIAEMLKITKSTIDRHIHRLGLVKKLDI